MGGPAFVYAIYIRTTPERLWQALVDPRDTRRYWRTAFSTDWKPGSQMSWELRGMTIDDPGQVVLEADPPHRLSFRWHAVSAEFSDQLRLTDDARGRLLAERLSRVTFDLAQLGDVVKLTITHDDFDDGSLMAQMVTGGSPSVFSNLKTLLETGDTLPAYREAPTAVRLGLTEQP